MSTCRYKYHFPIIPVSFVFFQIFIYGSLVVDSLLLLITCGVLSDSALQMYEHISDPVERAVLKVLIAAKGQAVKRQDIPSSVTGFSGEYRLPYYIALCAKRWD